MEETAVQQRINWSEEEAELVGRRYLELKAADPKLGEGAGLTEAQKVLPEHRRRRTMSGFSQAPRVLKFIHKQQVPTAEANGHAPVALLAPPVDPERVLADAPTEKLVEVLRAREPALFAKEKPSADALGEDDLIAALAARRPDLFAAGAPTATLIELVLGRFFAALTAERSRLEQAVTTAVVDKLGAQVLNHLNGDRAKFEQRLFDIQSQIRGLANGGIKNAPAPSAPAPEDKSAYMPLFLLAGGDRADFQRLQSQMMNASIRLQKIDVSKPQHISIPTHDRTVLWTARLGADLQASIRNKVNPGKLVTHHGTFDELGPVIVKEAQKVRDAMK